MAAARDGITRNGQSLPDVDATLAPPPVYGILSQTVIPSPMVHTVLSVQLRSRQYDDVALVGDHHVQICQVRDGDLLPVARLDLGVGERIRNAKVLGDHEQEDGQQEAEREDVASQMLLLVLEDGDTALLFLRAGRNGEMHVVVDRCRAPTARRPPYLGFDMAVEPGSRYAAATCVQDYLVVYELEAVKSVRGCYSSNQRPVPHCRSQCCKSLAGLIHKMEFLYPLPGDRDHIILLLVLVRDGLTRMVTYDWRAGDDLSVVFAQSKQGARLELESQLPQLLIPWTCGPRFLVVTEGQCLLISGLVEGTADCKQTQAWPCTPADAAKTAHHGQANPLWTAWTGSFGGKPSSQAYVFREDGAVMLMGARAFGWRYLGFSVTSAAIVCNSLGEEWLVIGSDSEAGGIIKLTLGEWMSQTPEAEQPDCRLRARVGNAFAPSPLLNWGTATDLAMMPGSSSSLAPDRMFSVSGHDRKALLTEHRYGLEARIALESEPLPFLASVRQAWVLPYGDTEYRLIFRLLDRSEVVAMDKALCNAEWLAAHDKIMYDTTSATLTAASLSDGSVHVQITERRLVLNRPRCGSGWSFQLHELLGMDQACTATYASVWEESFVIATGTNNASHLHVFKLVADASNEWRVAHQHTFDLDGELTCLHLSPRLVLVAGLWPKRAQDPPTLTICDLQRTRDQWSLAKLDVTSALDSTDRIASLVAADGFVLAGTARGMLLTLTDAAPSSLVRLEQYGHGSVTLTRARPDSTVFACCDAALVRLERMPHGAQTHRVWLVNSVAREAVSPPVDCVAALEADQILVVSDCHMLVAQVPNAPCPVPRLIPLCGTPSRMIYSEHLQCLVVALTLDDQPSLRFIDPDTGKDLGVVVDRGKHATAGNAWLGRPGFRVSGLAEWALEKDQNIWHFVCVSTRHAAKNQGRVLVLATKVAQADADSRLGASDRVCARGPIVWSVRLKKRYQQQQVYSLLAVGDSIVYGLGRTLRVDQLGADKKLRGSSWFAGAPLTALQVLSHQGHLATLSSSGPLGIIQLPRRSGQERDDELPRDLDLLHRDVGCFAKNTSMLEIDDGIVLVADWEGGVTGFWTSCHTPTRLAGPVVQLKLPAVLYTLRKGRTRPPWRRADKAPAYGRLTSHAIWGQALDGAMHHFTLLRAEAWQLLSFIQSLAETSDVICPLANQAASTQAGERALRAEPSTLAPPKDGSLNHVDGDILRRCHEARALGGLVAKDPSYMTKLMDLLRSVDDGKHTVGLEDARDYLQLASVLLDDYLGALW